LVALGRACAWRVWDEVGKMFDDYLDIVGSNNFDVEFMQVPAFEVVAVGSSYDGPYSRHVGYYDTVSAAVVACKGSGLPYNVRVKGA